MSKENTKYKIAGTVYVSLLNYILLSQNSRLVTFNIIISKLTFIDNSKK